MPRRRIGFWYRFAAVLCKPPLVVLIKRDWRGMENIPAEGGFITAVNHNSHVDPFAYAHYQYNTGRVPRFLAKAGLFRKGFVGAAMRGTGQIPVYRESTDALSAFRAAIDAVERGECVAFYPEGTLTRDPDRLADDRQDRCRPGRPADQVPGDPGGPVGRQRTAAAVRQEAQPAAAQDPPRARRAAGGPRALLRPGDDPGAPEGGHRGHHGRGHRAAGADPRREGPASRCTTRARCVIAQRRRAAARAKAQQEEEQGT